MFLRSKKLGQPCPVTPLLMVWGPERAVPPNGYRRDGDVYVVEADHPELWSHLFAAPTLTLEMRQAVHSSVQDYADTRAGHDAKKNPLLRHAMWTAFREGQRDSATDRKPRRELRRNLRRRHAHPPGDNTGPFPADHS